MLKARLSFSHNKKDYKPGDLYEGDDKAELLRKQLIEEVKEEEKLEPVLGGDVVKDDQPQPKEGLFKKKSKKNKE